MPLKRGVRPRKTAGHTYDEKCGSLQLPREIIFTPDAPAPPRMYSQAVRAAGLIFVSGTGPHDPKSGAVIGTTIQEQTSQCLRNISAISRGRR